MVSTSSDLLEALAEVRQTDVTRTIHQEPYPAIFPERHELSQAGRAVLITGGGGGVGFAIAKAFVRASATTIIIVGRRAEVLEKARSQLDILAKETGNSTKIITRTCDVTDPVDVDAFWKSLADQGIILDVYVANAAKFTEFKPLLELGTEEVWSQVETNVKSPLYLTEKFVAQAADRQKVRPPCRSRTHKQKGIIANQTSVCRQCFHSVHPRARAFCDQDATCLYPFKNDRHSALPAPCVGSFT